MSYVDDIFISDLKEILNEDWEIDNRAKWNDDLQTETKRIIQVSHKYDLSKGFPINTLREIDYKKAIDEMIWIYIKLSNNIKELNSGIWNAWADEEGLVQKAYGHQIAQPTMGFESQIHYVLNEIKTNPTSRRIQMNMFNVKDQETKAKESLIECAFGTQFSVKNGKLHMTLTQRSGDFLTAAGSGGWNLVQYAALQHAIANECGLDVGTLKHDIQDLHLYNKHPEQAQEMIRRYEELESLESLELPILKIADKTLFELTAEDFELVGYKHHGKIGKIEVAV
ncbi:thymidylate synthase [Bacillus xiapuensis]|uniref:thymidylate synthase n=1 Tax=Bacillus xiapuensis TaxID=2014075 RepID=A0ABU6NAB0_9BACI|nr:thymidylate synthase [Bacillus xiapuensis]